LKKGGELGSFKIKLFFPVNYSPPDLGGVRDGDNSIVYRLNHPRPLLKKRRGVSHI